MKRLLSVCISLLISYAFISCSSDANNTDTDANNATIAFEDSSDYVWDASSVVNVQFNTNSIAIDGNGATASGTTLTISSPGTYQLTGNLTNGQILVNCPTDGTIRILLNGVTVSNSSSSPFYIKKSSKTVVCINDGTSNSFSDASNYNLSSSNDEPSAAIFSNSNLTFFGNGSLIVKGNYADGISSDDGLLIKNGNMTVNATDDAIRGKDFLAIEKGLITATASTGHAIKSDNETTSSCGYVRIKDGTISASSTGGDAIHATYKIYIDGGTLALASGSSQGLKSQSLVEINAGNIHIIKSKEGVESSNITVNGGTINVISSDDSFNSTYGNGSERNDGSLTTINGGTLILAPANGDGLDSNGNIAMNGGNVIIHGPSSQPEVAIDYNGTFNITNGLIIASGTNSNMVQATSGSSSQCSLKIVFRSSQSASTIFHLEDSDGNELISFKPTKSYASIIYSSSLLKNGTTYSISTGGSYSGNESSGVYSGGTYSGGTKRASFTISSKVSSISIN